MKKWIEAFRLRTLPLSLSCILMGNILAVWKGTFDWMICLLTVLTTVLLQILSNLANDYGDAIHGADSEDRQGPQRAVQAGLISSGAMKRAVIVFAILSFLSGISLVLVTFPGQWPFILLFLVLGLAAIYAAITYTAGSKPYGYAGLGDISVFIFFGLVGVVGAYYLQVKSFDWMVLWPATTCGLLATGVLNVNNIRDIDSDQLAGKKSIPVRIGRRQAVIYHFMLIACSIVSALIFVMLNFNSWLQLIFLLTVPLLVKNIVAVRIKKKSKDLDPYLKQLALTTLLFVFLFGLGNLL